MKAQDVWKLPKISARDLIWLAGLLEGEGSFSLQHYSQPGSRWYVLPSIEVKMADRDVVQRAGKLLGGGQKQIRSQQPRMPRAKRAYIWRVNGRRAVHVMSLLLPHMGKRRTRRIKQLVLRHERTKGRAHRPATNSVRYRISKEDHRAYRKNYMLLWKKRQKRKRKNAGAGKR